MTKKGKDQYEDFYERAYTDIDIDKIYEEGGSLNISNFMQSSKKHIKDKGYFKVLKYNVKKRKWTVGGLLWDRYFKDEKITQNVVNRIIVKTGERFTFRGKVYKGGAYVPKTYFTKKG